MQIVCCITISERAESDPAVHVVFKKLIADRKRRHDS